MPAPPVRFQPGDRYGRLTVTEPARLPNTPGRVRHGFSSGPLGARCRCDCGNELLVSANRLTSGNTQSCGCLKIEKAAARLAAMSQANRSHGLSGHPLYETWHGMMMRCYDSNHAYYQHYGGRGIQVCAQWHDPARFIADIEAVIGPRPDGMTLDRPSNDGNYEPGNVRWATRSQQSRNRRPAPPLFSPEQAAAMTARRAAGVTLRELAEENGCSIAAIWRWTGGRRSTTSR